MAIESNFVILYLLISGLDLYLLNYITERKWVVASDGTRIPISILYRENQVKLDKSDPLLLYGYGSYEICIEPNFRRDCC
jgi:protease II